MTFRSSSLPPDRGRPGGPALMLGVLQLFSIGLAAGPPGEDPPPWKSLPVVEPQGEKQHTGSYTMKDPSGGLSGPPFVYRERAATGRKRARVVVVIYNPVLESEGGKRLIEYLKANDPVEYSRILANVIREASWGYLNYEIADFITVDAFPEKVDGFRYTGATFLEARKA